MFTVKLFRRPEDGLSLDRSVGVSAVSYSTEVNKDENGNFLSHRFECEDYKGNCYSWDIVGSTRVFVENVAGKTIASFSAGHA